MRNRLKVLLEAIFCTPWMFVNVLLGFLIFNPNGAPNSLVLVLASMVLFVQGVYLFEVCQEVKEKVEIEELVAKFQERANEITVDYKLCPNVPLTKELIISKYPEMYRDIPCGFNCPDGWLPLVDELSSKLVLLAPENFKVEQVKEKFGGLRFYTNFENEEISTLIGDFETRSYDTCDICAKEVSPDSLEVFTCGSNLEGRGWDVTRCVSCRKENDGWTDEFVKEIQDSFFGDRQKEEA